jgi:hypothetical protein
MILGTSPQEAAALGRRCGPCASTSRRASTRGRHVFCGIDTRRVAFCGTEQISTPYLAVTFSATAIGCRRAVVRQHLHLRRSPRPIASPPARTHHPQTQCPALSRCPNEPPRSFTVLERSIDPASRCRDRKFKPLVLGEIQPLVTIAAECAYLRPATHARGGLGGSVQPTFAKSAADFLLQIRYPPPQFGRLLRHFRLAVGNLYFGCASFRVIWGFECGAGL